jgi:hypothetical protein
MKIKPILKQKKDNIVYIFWAVPTLCYTIIQHKRVCKILKMLKFENSFDYIILQKQFSIYAFVQLYLLSFLKCWLHCCIMGAECSIRA